MGVSWKQVMDDWEIRFEICKKARYWY